MLLSIALAASLAWALKSAANGTREVDASLGGVTSAVPVAFVHRVVKLPHRFEQASQPAVLLLGTEDCAPCAAERWAAVKALARFGTWSAVGASHNSAAVPTFALKDASLSSWFYTFDSHHIADAGAGPAAVTTDQAAVLKDLKWRQTGAAGTPLLIAGRYVLTGPGVDSRTLRGRSFTAVQDALINSSSAAYVRSINAEANLITAILCKQNGLQPSVFCGRPVIRHLLAQPPLR